MQTNCPPNPFSQKTMYQVLKALGVEPGSAGFNQSGAKKTTQNVTDRSNSLPKTQSNSPPNDEGQIHCLEKPRTNFWRPWDSNQGLQDVGPRFKLQRQKKTTLINVKQNQNGRESVSSADLGRGSKYSYETYEDKVEGGKRFQVNSLFWTVPTLLQTHLWGPGIRSLCAPTPQNTAFTHCGGKRPSPAAMC